MRSDTTTLRRALLFVGALLLVVTVVIFEPQTAGDIAIAGAGVAMVLSGLYLTRRAEDSAMVKVERERDAFEAPTDRVPEDAELPRRKPFDGRRQG